jgi:hypothetical protein
MAALRTWLALAELGRSTPKVAAAMGEIRDLERDLLVGDAGVAPANLDRLFALVDGLHVSLFPPRSMPLETARSLLADFVRDAGLAA